MENLLRDNVKSANLMGIGYFYKQDQRDGFAWFQLEGQGPLWDVTFEQHKQIEKCFDLEMSLLEIGTHQSGMSLLEYQEDTKKKCEGYIDVFHTMLGYTNGKPMEQEFMEIEITNELMQLISMINFQIYYMSQWGTIPNDEYNGMQYVYKDIELISSDELTQTLD